jgi:membrane-associated protein
MELLRHAIGIFIHLDVYLDAIITQFGAWTYVILSVVVFCETGLVFTPFLPGDSLLFAAGAFAARGVLNPAILIVALGAAAILGDSCNYMIGKRLGRKLFKIHPKLLNMEHLEATERFYHKHGSKAVVFARFFPMFRTIAPFVAGIARMDYRKFFLYNVIGGSIWVVLFVLLGFFFGAIPAVEKNFTLVIVAIIVVSFLPATIHWIRSKLRRRRVSGKPL